ncbi:MAG TPA: hypothetical protein VMW83_11285 [Spirochaetia bacterium]|nr:hypothetical protein [Spirochaetia bacterium]
MSPALDRVSRDFAALTPVEKLEFLKSVTSSAPGEWVTLGGEIRFIPYDDEPWTEEDEADWEEGKKEIAEGKYQDWDSLKREFSS